MPTRRTRAQQKTPEMTITVIVPVDSPDSGSFPANNPASSDDVGGLMSEDVPSNAPPPLQCSSQEQSTPNYSARDIFKSLPAVGSSSEDQTTMDGSSELTKPGEDLRVVSPADEAPSKTSPAKESTPMPHSRSLSEGQSTTELQAGDPTATQYTKNVIEDSPAVASLVNGERAGKEPTTNTPERGVPGSPTENSLPHQATDQRQSDDHTLQSLPLDKPAVQSLPSSGELPDIPEAPLHLVSQENLPSSPPCSDNVDEMTQEGRKQKHKIVASRKKARDEQSKRKVPVIDLTTDSEDDQPAFKRLKNEKEKLFEATKKECEALTSMTMKQIECIKSLQALEFDSDKIIAILSRNPSQKDKHFVEQLGIVENKRCTKTVELRRLTLAVNLESSLITQNLASWYARNTKVSKRIEKSR